uniref:Uncharacterized protein n=1 Tax=Rhizophora mucronata TaxID=61149 RepID=A0A2P2PMB7_RHIMU
MDTLLESQVSKTHMLTLRLHVNALERHMEWWRKTLCCMVSQWGVALLLN